MMVTMMVMVMVMVMVMTIVTLSMSRPAIKVCPMKGSSMQGFLPT